MKFLKYLLLLLLPLHIFAQEGTYALPGQNIELATYVPTATAIKGMQYALPGNAHSYYYDEAANELIILTKKEKEIKIGSVGDLIVFDLAKNNVKWSAGINTFNINITAKYIITSEHNNTHCFNRSNGKQAWKKTDAQVKYIDAEKGIVLTDYIRALDINTGKTIWQKFMPVKYNWEDVQKIDETSIIVAAGGLYRVDRQTGKGWSTNAITSKEEYTAPAAFGIITAAQPAEGITAREIANKPNVWKSTTSGLLIEGNTIYFATSKRLLSLDKHSGDLNWETPLGNDLPGISALHISGERIALINEGKVANQSGVSKKYGVSYLALFNKQTGAKESTVILPFEESVVSTSVTGGVLTIRLETGFYRYDMNGNKELQTGKLDNQPMPPATTEGITLYYDGANTIYNGGTATIKTPNANKGFIGNNNLYIVDTKAISVIPLEEPK